MNVSPSTHLRRRAVSLGRWQLRAISADSNRSHKQRAPAQCQQQVPPNLPPTPNLRVPDDAPHREFSPEGSGEFSLLPP
ncbi:unnamed protein product [Mesocestoides corti]|uniref:Uncharacterized protein n=1 Tax=Mesocestoides corti TaxID=53468 RepID=A0A0R3U6X2_MESCO|nr:unnamed protein product [Mesocestoides corti]